MKHPLGCLPSSAFGYYHSLDIITSSIILHIYSDIKVHALDHSYHKAFVKCLKYVSIYLEDYIKTLNFNTSRIE